MTKTSTLFISIGLIGLAGLGVWLPLPWPVHLAAATLLAFFLPGWLLLQAIGFAAEDRLEHLTLAVGLSYALTTVVSLGLLYAAGYVSVGLAAGALISMSLLLSLVSFWRRGAVTVKRSLTRLDVAFFLLPVVVTAFFSFTNLDYADYWGDEMNGLLRALSIIGGYPAAIFEHTKGPAEIFLPTVFGLLVGQFDPFTGRFPFALAYTAAIGGYYFFIRQLFGRKAGLLAALFLSINGLYLCYGRLLQYQTFVLLMSSLAMLLAYRFYRGAGTICLGLSSFCIGAGLLGHYDILMALPPIGYLIWRRYGRQWAAWRKIFPQLLAAGSIALIIGAAFYIPFLLHPHIASTSRYLERVIDPTRWPSNNFDELYMFTVMYNSVYYAIVVALLGFGLVIAELVKLWRSQGKATALRLVVVVTVGLCLLAVATGWASLAPMLLYLFLFTLLIGFSTAETELKMVYIWLGVSFIVYVFFIDHPRNHLQIIYLGWSVLAALAVNYLIFTLPGCLKETLRRWVVAGAVVTLGLIFALLAGYKYLLFVDTQSEYVFTYPAHKNSLFWEDPNFPFGSRRLIGVPHRLGWQMINQLYTQGHFPSDWDSNDEGSNLFWYTLGAPRTPCYPRYYFLTHFEQREDVSRQSPYFNQTDYTLIGQVWNRDRLQIDVYEFAPLGYNGPVNLWAEPAHYASFVTPGDFHAWPYQELSPEISTPLTQPAVFQPHPVVLQQIAKHYNDPRITQVRDRVALLGYDLDQTRAKPGGIMVLTLYWQALEPVNLSYKIFTHLESDKLWSQADDFPACGTATTQRWSVGGVVADRHVLRLPAEIPPAELKLSVGLYEPATGARLDLLDTAGNPAGNALNLTQVTIIPQ